jgi:hypothetical protein
MLSLLIAVAQGPKFSGPTVPDGWGVNIHFTDEQPGEVTKIAGPFRWVRMDFAWSGTERAKGQYDFSAYDRLLASLKRAKIRPYFILDYGNELYEAGSPRHPESRAAFCRWVEAAMAHFNGRGIVWEMWNEPNIGFWKPAPNVDEYVALAMDVGKTIRRVAPSETYIGPATSGIDLPFLQRCLDAGLLRYWNAVSVHPYRQSEPESVVSEWVQLRSTLNRAGGAKVPMISGEWGYSELYENQDKVRQARYMLRQYLVNLSCGVPISIYYDWKDDGTDPKEPEHHFGTVYANRATKPAYEAAVILVRDLAGFSYVTRLHTGDDSQWLLLFRKGAEARVAAWTTSVDTSTRLPGMRIPLYGMPKVFRGASLAPLLSWKPEPWIQVSPDRLDDKPLEKAVAKSFGPAKLAQVTKIVGSNPVHLTVVPGRQGGLSAVLENPTHRNLDGATLLVGGGPKSAVTLAPDSTFTLPLSSGATSVRLQKGNQSVVRRVPRFKDLGLDGATATMDGDPKVRGAVSKVESADETKLEYDFDPGWRFAELRSASGQVEGKPTAFGIWIKGDGSGNLLRMRYTDASGQTFQPDGGSIRWTGWRYVSFPLDGSGGHWGGASDGLVHWPIRIGTVVLVDMPGGRGGQGSISVSRPSLAY